MGWKGLFRRTILSVYYFIIFETWHLGMEGGVRRYLFWGRGDLKETFFEFSLEL